jgi:hypothetical protein
MIDRGLMMLSAMLAMHGTKGIAVHRKTTQSKKVYLPVIQPEAMPLVDRKKLLAKKLKARRSKK